MDNAELVKLGQTVFNPLPGSKVGAKGYMGARVQPNSPTDDPDDIVWQVFDSFSYAVGDVVLGNNPVSGETAKIAGIERALQDVLKTFGLERHDAATAAWRTSTSQAEVERRFPGSTALWFQSLGSTVDANATFDVTVEKMLKPRADAQRPLRPVLRDRPGCRRDQRRTARASTWWSTRRASTASRARSGARSAAAQGRRPERRAVGAPERRRRLHRSRGLPHAGSSSCAAVSRTSLMGKLHGLPIGLDICSTLHMDGRPRRPRLVHRPIMPANPAYLMALADEERPDALRT